LNNGIPICGFCRNFCPNTSNSLLNEGYFFISRSACFSKYAIALISKGGKEFIKGSGLSLTGFDEVKFFDGTSHLLQ
jgi:hypothetical protein